MEKETLSKDKSCAIRVFNGQKYRNNLLLKAQRKEQQRLNNKFTIKEDEREVIISIILTLVVNGEGSGSCRINLPESTFTNVIDDDLKTIEKYKTQLNEFLSQQIKRVTKCQ